MPAELWIHLSKVNHPTHIGRSPACVDREPLTALALRMARRRKPPGQLPSIPLVPLGVQEQQLLEVLSAVTELPVFGRRRPALGSADRIASPEITRAAPEANACSYSSGGAS